MTRFVAPTLAYLLCLWAAWELARDEAEALGWLIAVAFLLLINAASNCWDLLKALGDPAA